MDDVLSYLEDVETWGPVYSSKGVVHLKGRVSAGISIELLPEITAIAGVQPIDEPSKGVGQWSNLQELPEPTFCWPF